MHAAATTRGIPRSGRGSVYAVAALFAAGVVLRLAAMATFSPAWYVNPDSIGYATAATGANKFVEVGHPGGYPYFLGWLHALSNHLVVVALVQHALGVVAAVLLYLAARRLDASRPVAAVPAAVALLGGDQLFFEHAILSEALFAFLLAAAVYAFVRGREGSVAWVAAGGAALGAAICVREVAVFLAPVFLGWMLWQGPATLRSRVLRGAATAVAALALVAVYVVRQHDATGYTGLARTSGWSAYARTAQFADCTQFTPPKGTARLCETTPSRDRPGPTFYHWLPASPAVRLFGYPPAGDAEVGRFGRAAMTHQPWTYVKTVVADELRYFGLHLGVDRPYGGTDASGLTFGTGQHFRPAANAAFGPHYADVDAHTAPASDALTTYQQVVRVHPPLVALLVVLSLVGLVLCTGTRRAAVALFGGTAIVVMAIPPVVLVWAWRYGVPAQPLLAASAAFGFDELQRRVRARRAPARAH